MIDQARIFLDPIQDIRIALHFRPWVDLLHYNATVLRNFSDSSESLHSDFLIRFLE